jgi:hypothetical protein
MLEYIYFIAISVVTSLPIISSRTEIIKKMFSAGVPK